MKHYRLCLWASLGLLVAAGGSRAQELDLKYKMKPGQEFRYRDWLVLASQAFGEEGPKETGFQWQTESLLEQRILSLENGVYELETQALNGEMTVRFGEREQTEELEERTEIVTLDERGKVLSRKEVDGKEEEEEQESLLDSNLPLRVLDAIYENLLFPSKAVKISEPWTDQADIKLTPENHVVGDLVSKVTRLVQVRGRPCAEILTHFVIPLNGSEEIEGTQVTASLDGQIAGDLKLYFDYEAGLDLVHLGEVDVILNIRMEVAEQSQENQTKTKIRIKTVLQEGK